MGTNCHLLGDVVVEVDIVDTAEAVETCTHSYRTNFTKYLKRSIVQKIFTFHFRKINNNKKIKWIMYNFILEDGKIFGGGQMKKFKDKQYMCFS